MSDPTTTNNNNSTKAPAAGGHPGEAMTPAVQVAAVVPPRPPVASSSAVKSRIQLSVSSSSLPPPPVVSARGRKKPNSVAIVSSSSKAQWPTASLVLPASTTTVSSSLLSSSSLQQWQPPLPTTTKTAAVSAKPTSSSAARSSNTEMTNATTTVTTTTTPAQITVSSNTKKKSKKKKMLDWPTSSADYLPPLADPLVSRLQDKKMEKLEFPINEECTALTLSPSGRLLIACFSDGTIRLFDLTGTFHGHVNLVRNNNIGNGKTIEDELFDVDSSSPEEDEMSDGGSGSAAAASPKQNNSGGKQILRSPHWAAAAGDSSTPNSTKKNGSSGRRNRFVLSKENQRFGAVASQIHAKGVHTSLLMDVDITQDGEYCFAGVLRGSMELVAVHLGAVEAYLDKRQLQQQQEDPETKDASSSMTENADLLDLTTVFRRSDAKLRGFGACTRLRNASTTKPPQYLLFTGKAIKNIHIWKFEPPSNPNKASTDDDAKWVQLYDTQTNGNTITQLQFRHDSHGLLQGISKSDNQKLRVWDLSYEQHLGKPSNPFYAKRSVIQKFATTQEKERATPNTRPKRPPFCDVAHSEECLNVCGGFSICCGGSTQYNQMSIVPLDEADLQAPYNHTELALPLGVAVVAARTSRRQQRGDLKNVVNVAGMAMDPGYVLLEVSDGSIIQYSHGDHGQPKVEMTSLQGLESTMPQEDISRKMCVGKIGSAGVVTAAVATYNSNNGRGSIILNPLNEEVLAPPGIRQKGFWGFSPHLRASKKLRKLLASSTEASLQTPYSNMSCPSPRLNTDISNWTHPPTQISGRSPIPETPSHEPSTSVKLFGSERQDGAAFMSPPPSKLSGKASKKRPPLKEVNPIPTLTAKKKSKQPVTVSTAKKRKATDGSSLCTPVAGGPAVVPQSSIQEKTLKRSKQDERDGRPPKKTSSKSASSQGRTTPPAAIPATPTLQSVLTVGGSQGKGNAQTSPKHALGGGVQQVSPDPKDTAASTTSESQPQPKKTDISQYLKNPSEMTMASPPVPRRRPDDTSKPSVAREVAEAMCELGSAEKKDIEHVPTKRSAVESIHSIGGSDNKIHRSKTAKSGRKSPAPNARKRPLQLVGSQDYKDQCVEQDGRLRFLKQNHIPPTSVEARMGLAGFSQNAGTDEENHELARMKLAAEHRANHEMLLKRVIHAAQFTIKALIKAETLGAVEAAEESFQDSFQTYYEILEESLWRQSEEASALAYRQRWEKRECSVPTLQVSFPFYGVFDEVIACVDAIIQKSRPPCL